MAYQQRAGVKRYPLPAGELLSNAPGLVCDAGKLCEPWRQLLLKYPERFMIGSRHRINQRWLYYDADAGATAPGWVIYA